MLEVYVVCRKKSSPYMLNSQVGLFSLLQLKVFSNLVFGRSLVTFVLPTLFWHFCEQENFIVTRFSIQVNLTRAASPRVLLRACPYLVVQLLLFNLSYLLRSPAHVDLLFLTDEWRDYRATLYHIGTATPKLLSLKHKRVKCLANFKIHLHF